MYILTVNVSILLHLSRQADDITTIYDKPDTDDDPYE